MTLPSNEPYAFPLQPINLENIASMSAKLTTCNELIVRKALERGISVELADEQKQLLRLTWQGKSRFTFESMSDETTAVAAQLQRDKYLCQRMLGAAGFRVPQFLLVRDARDSTEMDNARDLLAGVGEVAVKPRYGEAGTNVSLHISTPDDLQEAVTRANHVDLLIEEFVEGTELRVLVINYETVASDRKVPPTIQGNGRDTVDTLVQELDVSRRWATGYSHIPTDAEMHRTLQKQGMTMNAVPADGQDIVVRSVPNMHAGGTTVDVTAELCARIKDSCEAAARLLACPCVGFDVITDNYSNSSRLHYIEANERPGLEGHEPQPTGERFLDLLFPSSAQP